MDNLIQIIVFGLIIYSILAPILGKKKSENARRQTPNNSTGDVEKSETSSKTSRPDILEEMFGLRLPKTGDDYGDTYSQTETIDYETDFKTDYGNLETEQKMPDIDYDKLPSLELIQQSVKTSIISKAYDPANAFSVRTSIIRQKLANISELREFILISEILNKPKALRR